MIDTFFYMRHIECVILMHPAYFKLEIVGDTLAISNASTSFDLVSRPYAVIHCLPFMPNHSHYSVKQCRLRWLFNIFKNI